MAVFLLLIASFRVKIGLKNSYAPRVRLSDIFVRTRDPDLALLLYKPKSVKEINFWGVTKLEVIRSQSSEKSILGRDVS